MIHPINLQGGHSILRLTRKMYALPVRRMTCRHTFVWKPTDANQDENLVHVETLVSSIIDMRAASIFIHGAFSSYQDHCESGPLH